MTRFLIAVAAFGCLSAPAFADVCSAATEAATRAALASAEASGRRTSTVRVACGGEKQTLVLHSIGSMSVAGYLIGAFGVREVFVIAGLMAFVAFAVLFPTVYKEQTKIIKASSDL